MRRLILLLATFAVGITTAFAAATLHQQVLPAQINVGEQTIVTLVIEGGSVDDLKLPVVDGLQVTGTQQSTSVTLTNGSFSRRFTLSYAVTASKAGDFTIPAFDIKTTQGETLHSQPMMVHVAGAPIQVVPAGQTSPGVPPSFNPNGPVSMPPQQPSLVATTLPAPREADGSLAKVFIIISPQTTDAFVGEAVPMRIDFYIRMDVNADQNSLPTIKGSDFLMNSFVTRGQITVGVIEGQQYARESWLTAIAAPKSGDFPLQMVRDTYWVKSVSSNHFNPFGGFFGRHYNLAHEPVDSNQLVMHVHSLPAEGQPEHFTGAIGQFQVTGEAQPIMVAVGEPVSLIYTVTGQGNFDYVHAPTLPDDPGWKTYTPNSKIAYRDESHTQATKTFTQSLIFNHNGVVQLPSATFNYFDPVQRKYVSLPVPMSQITITGSAMTPLAAEPADGSASITTQPDQFAANRTVLGSLLPEMTPVYRHAWFWIAQGVLLCVPVAAGIFVWSRLRSRSPEERADEALRRRSWQQEEDAMSAAARAGDSSAFFLAARHSIQLRLGQRWSVKPEALTLGEIRSRDPELAETLQPLFAQADEVIYSGRATPGIDLAEWDRRVRELLQPVTT